MASAMMPQTISRRIGQPSWLGVILALALALRLAVVMGQDHLMVYGDTGGDSRWYLANGYALAAGFDEGLLPRPDGSAYPISLRNLPTPPLYLLFVGLWQMLLPPEAAIIAIRVIQALMGAAACYFAWHLGQAVSADRRAGLIAAGALAISPAFVLESAQITTETLYIFLLAGGLALYVGGISRPAPLRWLALAGVILGLATLTRAALLLFPLALALHLILAYGLRHGGRLAGGLLLAYGLVVASWTVYNLARWDRLVIAGEGFAAFLYIGATESGWQGGSAVDQALGDVPPETDDQQDIYRQQAGAIIAGDPVGYARRRLGDLAGAYLQPHGTLFFSGASLRDLALDWLRDDRSISGLVALTQGDAFWPKLALYVFHYAGLIGGLAGMWLCRGRWRQALPLLALIAYTTLIHLVLSALPRYLFPAMLFWWVFAGAGVIAGCSRLQNAIRTPLIP